MARTQREYFNKQLSLLFIISCTVFLVEAGSPQELFPGLKSQGFGINSGIILL